MSDYQPGRELDSEIEELFFGAVGRNEPRFFSTEAEPAMVILEKLHKQGYFWRLDSVSNGVIFTLQRLTGTGDPKNPDRWTYQVGASTIPHAVCLGALQTRGDKKESN